MNINFTGIQKANGVYEQYPGKVLSEGFLDLQLNNENGEDLKEVQELLSKFPSNEDSSFLKINFNQAKPPASQKDGKVEYCTRVNRRYLELNDENLKYFSQINKLLKKVSQMEAKELESPKEYLDSADCFDHVYGKRGVKELNDPKFTEDINAIHNPINVKDVAKNLQADMEEMMLDYFA